jgi:pyridoxine 5-phosphate synthase
MRLALNIDHVATVREARRAREPEPVTAAVLAELAGAEGITVHLRGDRRHVKDRDVELLRQVVTTKLNVEMAATPDMVKVAAEVKPDQVTLVPERPQELTTEGGLDVIGHGMDLADVIRKLHEARIRVSIFIDPDPRQVRKSRELDADAVEINTGAYSSAPVMQRPGHVKRVVTVARVAARQGLEVLAGHGLTYFNVRPIAAIPEIAELNIGHSIVSRAVLVGMERAVREMVALVKKRT